MEGLLAFGRRFDAETGCDRIWYMGADGVQRWADNDWPVDYEPVPYTITDKGRELLGGGDGE